MKELKKQKLWHIALASAIMLIGVFLILRPETSAELICLLIGAVLCVIGVVRIVCYFCRGLSVLWHRYELPLGMLDTMLGIYFLSRPQSIITIMPVAIGIAMIVDSVFKLEASLELRASGARGYMPSLLLALISMLAAIFLILHPFEGTSALMIYLGILLLIDGIQSLVFIHKVSEKLRKLTPVEAEYTEW